MVTVWNSFSAVTEAFTTVNHRWPAIILSTGFRSSQSTADLLTVESDRIARAFNRSGAIPAVALDISKAFNRLWHAGRLHKLNESYGISGQIFGLISSLLSSRWLWVVLDGKSSQEYTVNAEVPQSSILGPTDDTGILVVEILFPKFP